MENVKRFGEFGLDDEVISDAEIRRFCTVVNSVSDLANISDRSAAVVATEFTYSGTTLLPGDVLINNGTTWKKLSDVKKNDFRNCLNPPSKFRGYIVGNRAYLKWNDPDNTFITDSTDQRVDTAIWKETILVRKFGSEPQSMLDGTRVLIETSKNSYSDEYFTDVIPVDIDVQVYYKLYAVAHTGVITESSAIAPNVFTWENVSAELNKEDSRIRDMFSAGDVITISSNDSSVDLVVMGIDNVVTGSGNPHTMTLAFKYIDRNWVRVSHDNDSLYELIGLRRKTTDIEPEREKDYFSKDQNGNWLNLPTKGKNITEGTPMSSLYEQMQRGVQSDGIATWNKSFVFTRINCELHSTQDITTKKNKTYYYKNNTSWDIWTCQEAGQLPSGVESIDSLYDFLNGVDPYAAGTIKDDDNHELVYVPPYNIIQDVDADLASRIVETKVKSVVDGAGTTVETFQKFFIPSTTEVYDLKSGSIAEGKLLEYFEQFITEDENGKKFDPAGFIWTDRDGTICVWWTRSISRSDVSRGYVVDATNASLFTTSNAKESKACVVMFTIGQKQS